MPEKGNQEKLQVANNKGGQGTHGGISHEVEAASQAPKSLVAPKAPQVRAVHGA